MDWMIPFVYLITFLAIWIIVLGFFTPRYRKFTTEYILFFRTGKLRRSGYGGAYFLLPIIDELIVLPSAEQILDLSFKQVNLKAYQFVTVNCFAKWRVNEPTKVIGSLFQQKSSIVENINRSIGGMVDNEIRKKYNSIDLKQALQDKVIFSQALKSQLRDYYEPNGVLIITFQIQEISLEN